MSEKPCRDLSPLYQLKANEDCEIVYEVREESKNMAFSAAMLKHRWWFQKVA